MPSCQVSGHEQSVPQLLRSLLCRRMQRPIVTNGDIAQSVCLARKCPYKLAVASSYHSRAHCKYAVILVFRLRLRRPHVRFARVTESHRSSLQLA